MTIRELRREDYKGKIYTFSYVTHGFYSICAAPGGFSVKYTPLPAPVEKSFQDELFSPWLEAPRLLNIPFAKCTLFADQVHPFR